MKQHQKVFLVAGPTMLASALATGLIFSSVDKKPDPSSQSQVSLQQEVPLDDSIISTTTQDLQQSAAVFVSNPSDSAAEVITTTTGANRNIDETSHTSASPQNVPETERPSIEAEADTYQTHLPLVFLDYAHVLPVTEEVAAAVQKLQQDFVDSTGAATANPADPDYADLWNHFQPTADDRFYAIFGVEAFNALSIMEARQHGF